ncbi:hypothetical protein Bca4012_065224 [Brassica carinata]
MPVLSSQDTPSQEQQSVFTFLFLDQTSTNILSSATYNRAEEKILGDIEREARRTTEALWIVGLPEKKSAIEMLEKPSLPRDTKPALEMLEKLSPPGNTKLAKPMLKEPLLSRDGTG